MSVENDKPYKLYTFVRFQVITDKNDIMLYSKWTPVETTWTKTVHWSIKNRFITNPTSVIYLSEAEFFLEFL